jgi:hypothetical protein
MSSCGIMDPSDILSVDSVDESTDRSICDTVRRPELWAAGMFGTNMLSYEALFSSYTTVKFYNLHKLGHLRETPSVACSKGEFMQDIARLMGKVMHQVLTNFYTVKRQEAMHALAIQTGCWGNLKNVVLMCTDQNISCCGAHLFFPEIPDALGLAKEFSLHHFLEDERHLVKLFDLFLLSRGSAYVHVNHFTRMAWLGTHAMYMSDVKMPCAVGPQMQQFHVWAMHAQLVAVLPRLLIEAICISEERPAFSCSSTVSRDVVIYDIKLDDSVLGDSQRALAQLKIKKPKLSESEQTTLTAELVQRSTGRSGFSSSMSVAAPERNDPGTRFQFLHALYEHPRWPFEEAERTTRECSLLAYSSNLQT